MWTLSLPERLAIGGAAIALALQLVPEAAGALEYRRALLMDQPWRLLTAHVVHVNWQHAVVNCIAWWAVARLFATDLSARLQAIALIAGALGVDAALWLIHSHVEWYRGLSGALHALYFCGVTVWFARALRSRVVAAVVPMALAAAGWTKVVLEQPHGPITPYVAWLEAATVPQAHLAGAVVGTALAVAFFAAGLARRRVSRRAVS